MKKKPGRSTDKAARSIDWNEIHRRLEIAQTVIALAATPTAERKKRVLRARAEALASEPKERPRGDESLEVVAFLLAYENYAIESSFVREVYPLKELTQLPGTPPFVLGVTSVRGQILSVIDFKKFFDLPEKGLSDLNKLIIVHTDSMEFGVLADAILGVRSIPLADIQPPLPTLTGVRSDYLRGVTKDRLVVLDAAKVMADKRIIVHEETKR
ncbi:MAG: purine-binding chemotaxis protein CheW [Acidobacteria bacterium]|nr:purine-binding chemotaxis protein CheW [Acidobacteriota bacterium]